MVRLLNFFCVALAGLTCLALYRVSEQTRVANVQLHRIDRQIVVERNALHVLEADWQSVASPSRIQHLAQTKLGIDDTTTVQLSSFELLPRRGEDAPLSNTPIQQASLKVPAQAAPEPQPAPAPEEVAAPEHDVTPSSDAGTPGQ